MLRAALALYGVTEKIGPDNNPEIMKWARQLDLAKVYTADSIPWCGLFEAKIALEAGYGDIIPDAPLWAKSWAKFGVRVDRPMLGDTLVFSRNGGGHVGLYVGEDPDAYHVLGGNQSDMVRISRIAKTRLYAARRPPYRNQPANVRVVYLKGSGQLSRNEA